MSYIKSLITKFDRQLSFLVAAGVLALVLLGIIVYLTVFLGSNLSSVFTVGDKQPGTAQFDTAAYEKLKLPR